MSYKIYTPSETICDSTYPGNGCINPTLKQEVSKVWSLEFTLPPDHPEVNRITERQTEVGVSLDNGNPIFWGTVYGSKTDFFGQKTFYAEDELGYLNSAVMSPAYYEDKSISEIMQLAVQTYNAQCTDKQLTLGTVQTSHTAHDITWSSNYETVLDMLQQNVVAVGGGYLRVRYVSGTRYLDYSESYGSTTQVIRIGSNLIDYVREVDRSELASVLVPLGAKLPDEDQDVPDVEKRLTIYTSQRQTDRIVDNTLVSDIGTKVKTVIFDDIDDANALYSAGVSWLANQLANVTLTVCAFDLNLSNSAIDDIRLYDEVRVISEPHGLDANFPVTEMELHLNDPASNTLTLGKSDPPKITKNQIEIAERVELVPTYSDVVAEAQRQAALTLENATNGYVEFVFNQQTGVLEAIKIKDLTDPTTKWWIWNVNGLGYTDDGGQTYKIANTMNGEVVADTVTANAVIGNHFTVQDIDISGGTVKIATASDTNSIIVISYGTAFQAGGKRTYMSPTTLGAQMWGQNSRYDNTEVDAGSVLVMTTVSGVTYTAILYPNFLKIDGGSGYVKLLPDSLKFYDSNDSLLGEYPATGIPEPTEFAVAAESVANPLSGWGDGSAVTLPAGSYIIVAHAVNGGAYSYLKGRIGIKVGGSKVIHNEYYFNGAASDAEMECVYICKLNASSSVRATTWVPETAGTWTVDLKAFKL